MSIGRIEMVDGEKKFVPYCASGGAVDNADIKYIYIERFLKTETLLAKWRLTSGNGNSGFTDISAKMYDAATGEYLGKISRPTSQIQYSMQYIPLSFNVIPYSYVDRGDPWPIMREGISRNFFAYLGIEVNLLLGMFRFVNMKELSECPLFTWYKIHQKPYVGEEDGFKGSFPAFLFRGYLKKIRKEDAMYFDEKTKTLDDAESSIY